MARIELAKVSKSDKKEDSKSRKILWKEMRIFRRKHMVVGRYLNR